MKRQKRNPFTIIIPVIYALTILTYIGTLFISYRQTQKPDSTGSNKIEKIYSDIYRTIGHIMNNAEPGTEEFADKLSSSSVLKSYTSVKSDLAYITLSKNGSLIYAYPSSTELAEHNTSPLICFKQETMYSKDGEGIELRLAIYFLSPYKIYYYGRIAFSVILVATIICFIILMVQYKKSDDDTNDLDEDSTPLVPPSKPYKQEPIEEVDQNIFFDEPIPQATPAPKIKEESAPVAEEKKQESSQEYILEYKDDRPNRDELFSDADIMDITNDFYDEKSNTTLSFQDETEGALPQEFQETEASIKPSLTFEEIPEISTESIPEHHSDTKELYSPETGFGWEEYMMPRLNNELIRSTSDQQDLTLFVIRIPYLKRESLESKELCSYILETTKFQDLIFEYKEDGYSIIFQNTNIDQAIEFASEFHTGLLSILAKYGLSTNVSIGISAKSLRIISGERLFKEAEQALLRAMEDRDSPIIAFRVNADKYRKYVSGENS